MKAPYFFRDKPLLGVEITSDTVRIMQISKEGDKQVVRAYGSAAFSPEAIKNGVIADTGAVVTAVRSILDNSLKGDINTSRIAMSVPAARTFSRAISLPKLTDKELADAVRLEIEQYIPTGSENLYIDYSEISRSENDIELLVVAVPKEIVDSYIQVATALDLEPVIIETSLDSVERLFALTQFGNIPSVLIKYESDGVDISIIDKHIITTGTIGVGGNISDDNKLAPKTHAQSASSLTESLATEIRRLARYYNERYDKSRQIEQIVVFGSQGKMPDLASKMTEKLRLPARASDPWPLLHFESHLKPLTEAQKADFITVAGLAMAHASGNLAGGHGSPKLEDQPVNKDGA